MKKLRKKFKSRADVDAFINLLIQRVKDKQPITDNPMLDGMVIGWMAFTEPIYDLLLDRIAGRLLDGTLQKLEQITIWLCNNEDFLCSLIDGTDDK